MSTPMIIGIGLALLASVALNGSYLIQHLGSQQAPAISIARPIATLRSLLGSRLWLAGSVAGLVGWALHVAALSQAPLSLVQAFSAGGLALAVPLGAWVTHTRLSRRERRAIFVMGGALALLGIGAGGAGLSSVPAAALGLFLVLCLVGAGTLAALPVGPRRPHALGIAAGMLYGSADVATKAVTTTAHVGGLSHALLSPWALAIAVASAGAFFCLQRGLQLGSVLAVIALMTAVTNVVAIMGGLLVFREPLGSSATTGALHAIALILVAAAAWRLASAQARLAEGGHDGAGADRKPIAPPSANASACSTPARSLLGGITTTKIPSATSAVSAVARRWPARRTPTPASTPSVPPNTAEIP